MSFIALVARFLLCIVIQNVQLLLPRTTVLYSFLTFKDACTVYMKEFFL